MSSLNYQEREAIFRQKARELVAKMTLQERAEQTLYSASAIERLNIPHYNWWNEALHGIARAGTATVFPQAIAMAAAFDEDMMEEVGKTVAEETRAKFNIQKQYGDTDIYKGLTLWSPNINIFRDPRWGRGHETLGEDPYLTSRLGVRYINGLQGHEEFMKTAACAKHFAVHSGPENIRHEFDAQISNQDLYETYLPAFYAAITEAKVESVMGAYNRTNGEPCCGSPELLQNTLRKEWGFTGHVVSDCGAISDFHLHHHVTGNAVESAAMAMNNGCDLNCGKVFAQLMIAYEKGLVSEERLTEAAENLFTTRMKLGLFEEEAPFGDIPYTACDSPENRRFNLQTAKKCPVLLKNNGILPLKKENLKTLGVVGPNANSRNCLVGNYEGTSSRYVTILEGLQDLLADDVRVLYSEGCHLYKDRTTNLAEYPDDRISEVKAICAASDAVILCVGLDQSLEGEEGDSYNEFANGDKIGLSLPDIQNSLIRTVCSFGKPVILMNISGSAMDLRYGQENCDAVVQTFYPGAEGGHALAQLLFGLSDFEGKLPVTFYEKTDDLPEFTDYDMKGRTYRYMNTVPLYPFGYGLSYGRQEMISAEASLPSGSVIDENTVLSLNVTLKNSSDFNGAEALQVYVTAPGENAPKYQLKALKKVSLIAGEEKTVSLTLDAHAFGLFNNNRQKVMNPGQVTVYLGTQQPDERSTALTGRKCIEFTYTIEKDAVIYDGNKERAKRS